MNPNIAHTHCLLQGADSPHSPTPEKPLEPAYMTFCLYDVIWEGKRNPPRNIS
jgi:hypothetical protein